MRQYTFKAAATDKTIHLDGFTIADGTPYTSGAYNTSGIEAWYRKEGATNAWVQLGSTSTLVTQTATGAHTDNGFVVTKNNTYRYDLPDAVIADAGQVEFKIIGVTGAYFPPVQINVMGVDVFSAANPEVDVKKWNGTAVATPATAGYPVVTHKVGTGTGEVNLSSGKVPATIAAGDIATDALTAAAVKADAVTKIQSGLATASALSTVAGYIDTEVAAIKVKTDNLPVSPAAVSDIPTATAIRDALLNWEPFTGYSLAKLLRFIGTVFIGTKTGSSTDAEVYEAPDGKVVTIVADTDGNRTSVTTDVSGTP